MPIPLIVYGIIAGVVFIVDSCTDSGVTDEADNLEDGADMQGIPDKHSDGADAKPQAEVEAKVEEVKLPEKYCTKPGGINPYVVDTTTFVNDQGMIEDFSDSCKIVGKNGLLAEGTCDGYDPANPVKTSLITYIMCNCEEGKCVEDTVVACTDPEAGVHVDGASVWTDEETGKTHISTCPEGTDQASVIWYYCNDDGTFHMDEVACTGGLLCGDGMCGGYICTDDEPPGSDPTNEHMGTLTFTNPTTGGSGTIEDYCLGDGDVWMIGCPLHTSTEWNSLQDEVYHEEWDVAACDEGLACDDGICGEYAQELCVFDSDPDNDIHVAGELSMYDPVTDEVTTETADGCSYSLDPQDDGTFQYTNSLIQQDCSDDGIVINSGFYDCDPGELCVQGACIASSGSCMGVQCTETDNGNDIMKGGHLTLKCDDMYLGSSYDHCIDGKQIDEKYCNGSTPMHSVVDCPPDFFCVDNGYPDYEYCGTCEDSDPGDEASGYGEVLDIHDALGQDFCNSDGELMQVRCNPLDGTVAWSEPEACPSGMKCVNGACKE